MLLPEVCGNERSGVLVRALTGCAIGTGDTAGPPRETVGLPRAIRAGEIGGPPGENVALSGAEGGNLLTDASTDSCNEGPLVLRKKSLDAIGDAVERLGATGLR